MFLPSFFLTPLFFFHSSFFFLFMDRRPGHLAGAFVLFFYFLFRYREPGLQQQPLLLFQRQAAEQLGHVLRLRAVGGKRRRADPQQIIGGYPEKLCQLAQFLKAGAGNAGLPFGIGRTGNANVDGDRFLFPVPLPPQGGQAGGKQCRGAVVHEKPFLFCSLTAFKSIKKAYSRSCTPKNAHPRCCDTDYLSSSESMRKCIFTIGISDGIYSSVSQKQCSIFPGAKQEKSRNKAKKAHS